jgi:hypothetical protein
MFKSESFGEKFLELHLPFLCELHHCYPRAIPDPNRFCVLIHTAEPSLLKWDPLEVRKYHSNFDLILTSEKKLLDLYNTKFLIFGDSWIKKQPENKVFSISYLHSVGIRQPWNGYELRKDIWKSRFNIDAIIPLSFWYSSRRPPDLIDINSRDKIFDSENKDIIFESMFSIVIENISEYDYFSEKIVDCFATMTIPIYFGCINISEYFDVTGIIIINCLDDLITILEKLTIDDYYKKIDSIIKNYLISKKYWDGKSRIKEAILEKYISNNENKIRHEI